MTIERSTIVRVKEGLHARPATRFVKLAKSYQSEVEIARGDKAVNAKSSVKLMLLAVKEGDSVKLNVSGPDEQEASDMLISYLENPEAGLEAADDPSAAAPSRIGTDAPMTGGTIGIPASAGTALGPVFAFFPPVPEPAHDDVKPQDRPAEKARLRDAIASVTARMQKMASGIDSTADAQIVTALIEIAGDEDLVARAEATIDRGLDAVSSTLAAAAELAAEFEKLEDPYLRARADDIHAVARQICLALTDEEDVDLSAIPHGAILVADDLGAYDLARAPLARIAGIACGQGGATSHVAIIARNHGIPAVLGLGEGIDGLAEAARVGIDGGHGRAYADPDDATQKLLQEAIAREEKDRASLQRFVDARPIGRDGAEIEIAANLGSLQEVENARKVGAMGVGLFRTELMFMAHSVLPGEDEQYDVYARLVEAFAPDPVIVRTLDVGGDKPVAGIDFPAEENPFLGWRGIRMCLDRPVVFKPQLKALMRAAVHGNLKVMLPMISQIGELRRTRAIIKECRQELDDAGISHGEFQLGVMIETPAAVLVADDLAREADFFSIGTNDLTQYVMAADRLNASLSTLCDVRNPAVMKAIEMTARAGRQAGIMVGICGEAAADVELIPTFLEFGITELSMSPAAILAAKKAAIAWSETR